MTARTHATDHPTDRASALATARTLAAAVADRAAHDAGVMMISAVTWW